jgi:hypothetical protein
MFHQVTVLLCSIQNCLLLVIVIASHLFDAPIAEIYYIDIIRFSSAAYTNKPSLVVTRSTTTITCKTILTTLLLIFRLHITTYTPHIYYLISIKDQNGIFVDRVAFKLFSRFYVLLFGTFNTTVHFRKVAIVMCQLNRIFAAETFTLTCQIYPVVNCHFRPHLFFYV